MPHASAVDVMDEIAELTPPLARASRTSASERRACSGRAATEHPGHAHPLRRALRRRRAGARTSSRSTGSRPARARASAFPFILITGRQLAHYNSGTQTRRTGNVELQPADLVEIHPTDAERLGAKDGDLLEIESARGKVQTHACVTTRVAPGNVFLSFHFPEVKTNLLTSGNADRLTSCPEYKVTAVDVAQGAGRCTRLRR